MPAPVRLDRPRPARARPALRRCRTIHFAALDKDGKVLITEASPTPEYRVPDEGSFNDRAIRFVCFRQGGTRIDNPLADAEWRLWQ